MSRYFTPCLSARDGAFYFRKATPAKLRPVLAKREIKVSLKTRNPDIARIRCRSVSNFIDRLTALIDGMTVTNEDIDRVLRSYFEERIRSMNEIILFQSDKSAGIDIEHEKQGALEDEAKLRAKLATADFSGMTELTARDLIKPITDVQLIAHDEKYSFLCRGVLRAEAESLRIYAAKLSGNYHESVPKDPLFKECSLEGFPDIPGDKPAASDTVQELIDEYVELKSHSRWGDKSKSEYVRVFKMFASLGHGKKRIGHITKADITEFRKILLTMPPNYAKKPSYKNMSLKQVLELNQEATGLSAKTFGKYYGALKAFFKWCEDEEKIVKSPVPKTTVQTLTKLDPQEARFPLENDHLQQLFNSPVYTGCKSKHRRHKPGDLIIQDALYWIPLIFLYSGMRPAEICQLRPKDIRIKDNIYYFDVNEEDGKRLKNKFSIRKLPVHDELFRLGFMDFYKSRQSRNRIFDDAPLGAKGDPADPFSKTFHRYFEKAGLKKPGIVLYSMRHNFRDALSEAKVEDSVINRLIGHKDDRIAFNTYGSKFKVPLLFDSINRIKYDIDLSHLYPMHGGGSGQVDGKKYGSGA